MQKESTILDDLARMATGAASGLTDMRRQVQEMMADQLEKLLGARHLVTREEFETVRLMASKAREENEKLRERLLELENSLKDNNP